MMLTLYGLPPNFHYKDVKALIRTQCEIIDFILDNLSIECGFKKIRVGLATESEGHHLTKCLDGFQLQGCVLKVTPIVKAGSTSEAQPIDGFQRGMNQPSYDAVQPNPWMNQDPHWQGNQLEPHGAYQQFPQNQPYLQPQHPHQPIPIVNRQGANQFQTPQNYEKPMTIMKDNFQGPSQYNPQPNQNPQYQQSWAPHMQETPQYKQIPNKVQNGSRQLRDCEVIPNPVEGNNEYKKGPGLISTHSQFGSSNRQVPHMTGNRMSPGRRETRRNSPYRQMSPERNLPVQRATGNVGNMSSPDGRRELGHKRRLSPIDHEIPSGRHLLLSGRYNSPPRRQMPQTGRHELSARQMPQSERQLSPPGQQMPQSGRHLSPPGRQMSQSGRNLSPPRREMPQRGRLISPPGRQMPQSGRHISPPGRQMPQSGRHISPSRREMPQRGRPISPPDRQMPRRHISPPGSQIPGKHGLLPARKLIQDRLGSPPRSVGSNLPSASSRPVLIPDIPGRNVLPSGRFSQPERTVLIHERPISPGKRVIQTDRSSGRQISPSRPLLPTDRLNIVNRAMPSERVISPMGRRFSPSGRRISPPGRRISPPERRISSPGRRVSPPGRRISPPGRRISPSGRRVSPLVRRISPPGRRVSPPGRRISPSGRRVSPPGRHTSPSGRPLRQQSPGIRRPLPMQQDSRQHNMRYSPSQHQGPPVKHNQPDSRFKHIVPQYDKATDQGMSSSGFRPKVPEDKLYSKNSLPKESRWRDRTQYPPMDADRSMGPYKGENRFPEHKDSEERKKSRSLTRESIRDRSPIRDRFKNHSPSPRSPRRSWILEKRHSPDTKEAPPPPVWPGQDSNFQRPHRPQYPARNQKETIISWHREVDERHRGHPDFDEKDTISNWKPRLTDNVPQRFSPANKFKFERKHFEQEDTYVERQKPGDFSHSDDSRQHFVARHNPYKNEETSRQGNSRKESLHKREVYKAKFEIKQNFYADERKEAQRKDSQYVKTTQDRNPKDYLQQEERTRNEAGDFRKNQEDISEAAKEKRERAVTEISEKIIAKWGSNVNAKRRRLIFEELKAEVGRMLHKMFGDKDVSFIESVISFNAKHTNQVAIFKRAAANVFNEFKNRKMQNMGDIHQRIKKNQVGQKRAQPTPSSQQAKFPKHDETHTQINRGKAILTKQSQVEPKQPEITQVAAKTTTKPIAEAMEPSTSKDVPKIEVKRQSGDIKVLTVSQINEQTDCQGTQENKKKTKCENNPAKSEDIPAKSEVIPAKSEDIPAKSKDIPAKSEDIPAKSKDIPAKSEDASGEYFELNELMSKILKKELRDMMDKVWSVLLEQPQTAAEVVAADLIRYDAVDHIRTAIGSNVTQRLLNVFNTLFIKIHFSCRPENGCLTSFLKEHKIKSFKRIPNAKNTFVAQLQDIADFDTLCFTKHIKCGSADLKITPFYKFTQCPTNLKLNLDDDEYYVYPSDDEYDEDNDSDAEMFDEFDKEINEKVEGETPTDKENDQIKISNNETKIKIMDTANEVEGEKKVEKDEIKSNKEETKSVDVDKQNKTPVEQPKDNPTESVSNEKTQIVNREVKSSESKEKIIEAKTQPIPKNKEAIEKINKDRTEIKAKENPTKGKTIGHQAKKSVPETKKKNISQTKKGKQRGVISEAKRRIFKPKSGNKRNTIYEVIDEEYDDEEMNDEDILALLSGGVVLDECGSDD